MAVARAGDPRIYARAAKLSTLPSRYVFDDVKYTACLTRSDLPTHLDDTILVTKPFDPLMALGDKNECTWTGRIPNQPATFSSSSS